jgi:hypothetical protein
LHWLANIEHAYVDVDKTAEADTKCWWDSADGIDMDVIIQMRMGTSASLLEKEQVQRDAPRIDRLLDDVGN